MLDLHNHTTASDGALSPTELVARAARIGVRTLAVTDHDTIAALDEARLAGQRLGVDVVPGIEISATDYNGRAVHVLGYLFDPAHPSLLAPIKRLGEGRHRRNLAICDKLTELGVPIAMADVAALANGNPGRPHFAQLLVSRGHVSSYQEAFDRWLADGRPAHVPKNVMRPKEAIACLHAAGGVAVLAHPLTLGRGQAKLEATIRKLARQGLDGIEVYCSGYTPGEIDLLRCFADRYGLVATGGSDFHREPGPAQPKVPAGALDALRLRSERYPEGAAV